MNDQEFTDWSDLLGEAMQGKLDYERIAGIPALVPIANDSSFYIVPADSLPERNHSAEFRVRPRHAVVLAEPEQDKGVFHRLPWVIAKMPYP